DQDEYRVLILFIVEGFRNGDKAFHIVDPKLRGMHLERLQQAGIDVAGAQRTGQLEVSSWEESHLSEGRFDQDRIIALIQEALERGKSQRFPLTRVVFHTGSVLEGRGRTDEFLEYEAGITRLLMKYRDPVI
ncbi:MAG TPA: MEDS domain-containing protein, partial [Myxococcaceae bacterium]|nr:MEDS domain-containing protein [Myxococcaceae bacterium]